MKMNNDLQIFEKLKESKSNISSFLAEYLSEIHTRMEGTTQFADDFSEMLLPYCLGGKMIRGSLLFYMYSFLTKKGESNTHDALKAAAAIELINACLLIHDDIMDGDVMRRGLPSMHMQYAQKFNFGDTDKQVSEKIISQLGPSLAICLGDEALFLAMDLLARLPDVYAAKVMRCIAPLMVKTGLGQSQDVLNAVREDVSREDIIATYINKTALYTFTTPLCVGAVLAGKPQAYLDKIDSLGKALGMLYQLRDDYLGICGDPKKIGKETVSDVVENKKTLLRMYILEQAELDGELSWINPLFGNAKLTESDHQRLCKYILDSGVKKRADAEMDSYYQEAIDSIQPLALAQDGQRFFTELATYLRNREA